MNQFFMIFFVAFVCAISVNCCSTKNDYHYNVVTCDEPQIQALGQYILDRIKTQREVRPTTCENDNGSYLKKAPFKTDHKDFDSRKLAGVWVYKSKNEPGTTFAGAEETLQVLQESNTFNVLIDKKFSVKRYVLRNNTDGAISVAYLSDEELMRRISTEMYWNHQDVVECQHFLHFLSNEFPNQLFSITVVDKYNSNNELRFIMASGGIGGFIKKHDNAKETEEDGEREATDD